jgi:cell division septal protein FtsQ
MLVGAAVAAIAATAFFASRSSVFHARGIEVVGASHLSRAEVVATAGVSRQTNVLWFDQEAVERSLERDPWVASADVGVSFPWDIRIAIVERIPVAIASSEVGDILVAGDGTQLGPAGRSGGLPRIRLPLAPVFEGLRASPAGAATAVGALAPEIRGRVSSVTVLADGTLRMRLDGGVIIRYGSASGLQRKADAIGQILTWAASEGERLVLVNVVAPDLPAVKLAG